MNRVSNLFLRLIRLLWSGEKGGSYNPATPLSALHVSVLRSNLISFSYFFHSAARRVRRGNMIIVDS